MLVLRSLKGRCYGKQSIWGVFTNYETDRLQSLLWHSETECSIAICIKTLTPTMMQSSCKNLVFSNPWDNVSYLYTFISLLCKNRPMISIRRAGISKSIVQLKCWWAHLKQQWTCKSHINLVHFYLILLQLMRLNCLQHQSALGLIDLCSPRGSTSAFCYY